MSTTAATMVPNANCCEMGTTMTVTPPAPWPLQTRLELAAIPTAPSVARGHVRSVTREWGLAALADTAELLVSELVTNAIQASAKLRTVGPPVVRIWITSDGIALVIHVWDASNDMPVLKDMTVMDEEGGRGLILVATLGKDWGFYRKAEGGKVVWVMISRGEGEEWTFTGHQISRSST
jgi:anti-sigma regulatory factor (Ser/Thr protein kinase)